MHETDSIGLNMFHITSFYQENVYYISKLDTYAVVEMEEGNLDLLQVI